MPGREYDDEQETQAPRRVARSLEERLAELAAAGALSHLPGEGAPFPEDPGSRAGDLWAAQHLMANERILPAWAELAREIEAQRERLVRRIAAHGGWLAGRATLLERVTAAERILEVVGATRAVDERFRAGVGAEVAALNHQIARFNASAPVPMLQRAPLDAVRLLGVLDRP